MLLTAAAAAAVCFYTAAASTRDADAADVAVTRLVEGGMVTDTRPAKGPAPSGGSRSAFHDATTAPLGPVDIARGCCCQPDLQGHGSAGCLDACCRLTLMAAGKAAQTRAPMEQQQGAHLCTASASRAERKWETNEDQPKAHTATRKRPCGAPCTPAE